MKKTIFTLIVLSVLVVQAGSAFGARGGGRRIRVEPGEFVSYKNSICRFRLWGVRLSEEVERSIVFGVERIRDTYEDTFEFEFDDDFEVTITIIRTPEDFKAYQLAQIGEAISETGYFSAYHNETVVWANKSVKKMIGVLFHEANHLMVQQHIPYCPYWINEGLSEYFEGFNVIGRNKRVYLQNLRHQWVKKWLRDGFPISVEDYLGLSYREWQEFMDENVNAAYTMGYSLVYFMMSHPKTEELLKEILWELKEKKGLANSVRVVNETYPGGMRRFELHWKRWIPRARPYRPLRVLRERRNEKILEEAKEDEEKQEERAQADEE
ncbi:hypothetical protein STSP2_00401 [Anaerohalosphaera lusitana]|uniref:DUF1570 domain-containing protein n=1 Tax=Anaerohalosphaera lusitana TaxID=1936003 RepID=A0A1U9NHM5_9BACT|nr:DUF1570 domain-containing protein [Anaerohalosphaera lusitana]AQT67258.1 hypothetical protein STSP2_00401 [Anaerohalosphaera lusitana]